MIQSSTTEIIFNPKTIADENRLKKYLNQLNGAVRGKQTTDFRNWLDKDGKQCYLLESNKQKEVVSGKNRCVCNYDFLFQSEKPNAYQLYSVQIDYSQQPLDEVSHEKWIKQMIQENPGTTDDDWRFMQVLTQKIEKCAIFYGQAPFYEVTYADRENTQSQNQLSMTGRLYQMLKNENAFKPIKSVFFDYIVPASDQKIIHPNYTTEVLKKHIQRESR